LFAYSSHVEKASPLPVWGLTCTKDKTASKGGERGEGGRGERGGSIACMRVRRMGTRPTYRR
jgi:hypothetical protein